MGQLFILRSWKFVNWNSPVFLKRDFFICSTYRKRLWNGTKWIPRSKSGASKSRPRWAAHTRIGSVWEYPPSPGPVAHKFFVVGAWGLDFLGNMCVVARDSCPNRQSAVISREMKWSGGRLPSTAATAVKTTLLKWICFFLNFLAYIATHRKCQM